MNKLKNCFFITPMGEENSETDKRSKNLIRKFNSLFSENDVYIKVQRTDQYRAVGCMTSNIQQQIVDADLVIADLTGSNPNVAYELGYANAYKKPIIQICKSTDFQLFSDIGHIYTLNYELDDDSQSFKFEQKLLKTIELINFDTDTTFITPTISFTKVDEVPD